MLNNSEVIVGHAAPRAVQGHHAVPGDHARPQPGRMLDVLDARALRLATGAKVMFILVWFAWRITNKLIIGARAK